MINKLKNDIDLFLESKKIFNNEYIKEKENSFLFEANELSKIDRENYCRRLNFFKKEYDIHIFEKYLTIYNSIVEDVNCLESLAKYQCDLFLKESNHRMIKYLFMTKKHGLQMKYLKNATQEERITKLKEYLGSHLKADDILVNAILYNKTGNKASKFEITNKVNLLDKQTFRNEEIRKFINRSFKKINYNDKFLFNNNMYFRKCLTNFCNLNHNDEIYKDIELKLKDDDFVLKNDKI